MTVSANFLLVRYAGNPSASGIAIALVRDADAAVLPLRLPRAARHGWLVGQIAVPTEWQHVPVQLRFDGGGGRPGAWLAVRALAQSDMPVLQDDFTVPDDARPLLAALASAVLLLLWLGASQSLAVIFAACAAASSLIYLQYPTFYHLDDYQLLEGMALGGREHQWVYNGHFEPLFLWLYSASVRLVRDWYAPLQIAMVLGHAAVATALLALLRNFGVQPRAAALAVMLFVSSWLHVDVVPWFMEASFLLSSGLAVVTLICLQHRRVRLGLLCAAAACLLFTNGLMVPWLAALGLVLFRWDVRWRRHLAYFVALGLSGLLLASEARHLAQAPPVSHAGALGLATFWATGVVRSTWCTYLGMRGMGLAGLGLLVLLLGVASRGRHSNAATRRLSCLGLAWLGCAYVLPALARADFGAEQAMSFRYTYFALLGASLIAAAAMHVLLQSPRSAPWVHAALLLLGTTLTQGNHYRALKRLEHAESEFFAINQQTYELTRLQGAHTCGEVDAPMPKTLVYRRNRYLRLMPVLDAHWAARPPPSPSTCAALDALTAP